MMSGAACSSPTHTMTGLIKPNGHHGTISGETKQFYCSFQMPLHYPRFNKSDYESMPEWKLDCLLSEYGLPVTGDLAYKKKFAMGAFLWPNSQNH
ncbi:hypothetical protein Acr_15g0000930 [Actinidia rufa]|uniref:DUF7722 domain-containing protein n=1 Tax=Actinidia rufa TaxID=165716 RepID=A0A7J0FSD9_9ERIC|nr:hypothetical protein Acr_15g0000930 [Actinidia rufa]